MGIYLRTPDAMPLQSFQSWFPLHCSLIHDFSFFSSISFVSAPSQLYVCMQHHRVRSYVPCCVNNNPYLFFRSTRCLQQLLSAHVSLSPSPSLCLSLSVSLSLSLSLCLSLSVSLSLSLSLCLSLSVSLSLSLSLCLSLSVSLSLSLSLCLSLSVSLFLLSLSSLSLSLTRHSCWAG